MSCLKAFMFPFILFTDLDDTLFHSRRKKTPLEACRPAAYLQNGEPVSYADPKQQAMLAHWLKYSAVIPVTARDSGSFGRVDIPFAHHAVIDYGGVILNPDGQPDARWLRQSRHSAAKALPGLQCLADSLRGLPPEIADDLNIRLIGDFGITFYLLLKSRSGRQSNLNPAATILRPLLQGGEKLHLNANNLAVLPAWLDKRNAVLHLLGIYRRLMPDAVTLGMGDSLTDLPFMQACDYRIVPAGSQIADKMETD